MKSYPNSLGAETGLEPATFGLWGRRATTALPRNMKSTRITMGANALPYWAYPLTTHRSRLANPGRGMMLPAPQQDSCAILQYRLSNPNRCCFVAFWFPNNVFIVQRHDTMVAVTSSPVPPIARIGDSLDITTVYAFGRLVPNGRRCGTRTHGILLPKQARYQLR